MHNLKYNDSQWETMLSNVKKEGKKRRFIRKVKVVSGSLMMLVVLMFSLFYTLEYKEYDKYEKKGLEKYNKELLAEDEELDFAMYVASLDNVIYDNDLGAIPIY